MPSHHLSLSLPGGRTRVCIHGDGPALLWAHGVFFPIDVDDRSTLGRVLSSTRDFTVIRWDARGHGQSEAGPDGAAHRWDRMANDVLALADALSLDRFAAGGISMGAAVTLHAALAAPERVAAMLLFALPTAWTTRPAEQERYRSLLGLGSSDALADFVTRDLDEAFGGAPLAPALAAMVSELRSAPWTATSRVIEGAAESDMPPLARLAALRVPTLLRPWPNDTGHPLSTAEALAAALPKAHLALLDSFDDEAGMRAALEELRLRAEGLAPPPGLPVDGAAPARPG